MLPAQEAQLNEDIVKVVRTKEGARLARWLIFDLCGLEQPSFSSDSLVMSLNEGRRCVGRDLVNRIRQIDDQLHAGLSKAIHEVRFQEINNAG